MPDRILGYIPDTFASPEAMKAEMLATAEAMFGSGWVWLVLDMGKRLRILCTYNAGSPYGQAHRRQETDMNTTGKLQRSAEYSVATAKANKPYGAQEFIPLLNINCWEHAWIVDYGVRGKQEYLENLWERIDWEKVESRLGLMRPSRVMY
ncbi:uncharacterized protein H6S33_005062 [Morchella sextelata]|jgi:Fe-Mn family superoxide dismutase|uniref:uncharacterized protein n=1 Tax=Morchella sextelata TaxID=1174677 RepID=UPI001D037927|nr:uncharacterized protein H6S33_005062 [Morchella sextelata]KAH0605080.1 hypothetical protein H6S33_005062 [Morchella sextelata]